MIVSCYYDAMIKCSNHFQQFQLQPTYLGEITNTFPHEVFKIICLDPI
jgi:hypothetical protein